MKIPNLSRRIYNSSFTLAISFGFYALIFLFTLSCEGEEANTLPAKAPIEDASQQSSLANTALLSPDEAVSPVEKIAE